MNRIITFISLIYLTTHSQLSFSAVEDNQTRDPNHLQSVPADTTIKSPRGAMVRSLLLPGWGQYYNEKKLKALIIAGAEIGLLTNAIIQNQFAVKATSPYNKEIYRDYRGLSLWYLAGLILYSMADAYVDAHLYEFDESTNLSLKIQTKQRKNDRNVVSACVLLRF